MFFKKIELDILSIIDTMAEYEYLRLEELNAQNTALVIINMVNGFCRDGILHSKRIEDIIPIVSELASRCAKMKIKTLAISDAHDEDCSEFRFLPKHCVKGTAENQLIDELKAIAGCKYIEKNSANGFHAPGFQKFMIEHPDIDTYLVCGNCTEGSIMNFCITLKTYLDQFNKKSKIIVPMNAIETYDMDNHNGELCNITAVKIMADFGINIVKGVL